MTETLQNFSTFCHFSFKGRGGVKKETKGIKFFIRHRHFDVAPYTLEAKQHRNDTEHGKEFKYNLISLLWA